MDGAWGVTSALIGIEPGRVTAAAGALMNCPLDLRPCLWMAARGHAMRNGRSMYPCCGQLAVQARVMEPRDERVCRRKVRRLSRSGGSVLTRGSCYRSYTRSKT